MKKFVQHTGIVAPLDRANVDTDAIIPKQFLKSVKRTGFGQYLFDAWRYLDQGEPGMDCSNRPENPDFVLNQERYRGATILLTRANFGCGSSREHAPWALMEYGFRVLIAPSFADIFYNNCFKNGLLPITLDGDVIDELFQEVEAISRFTLDVDIDKQTVEFPEGRMVQFDLDPSKRRALLEGLDEIGMTLMHREAIEAYETARRREAPWLFQSLGESAPLQKESL